MGGRYLTAVILVAATMLSFQVPPGRAANEFAPNTTLQDNEERFRQIENGALSDGALGFLADEATGGLVVVMPEASPVSFNLSAYAALGIPLRVETRPTSIAQIDTVSSILVKARSDPRTGSDPYWFYFDAQSGKVRVYGTPMLPS